MRVRLASLVAVALMVVGMVAAVRSWPPFQTHTTITQDTKPLQLKLTDLHEYHAAQGAYQVVVTQKDTTSQVPEWLLGEKTTMLATGTVDAVVDFSHLGGDAIHLDGKHVTITLPSPTLAAPRIDPEQTQVVGHKEGLADRLGDLIGGSDPDTQPITVAAQDKITAAAETSDLQDRAKTNTTTMLTGLAKPLGYESVTVTYGAAS